MHGQRRPNKQCEFVDVGGGHKARLVLRRTTIGAQSVVKTMDLLVVNLREHLISSQFFSKRNAFRNGGREGCASFGWKITNRTFSRKKEN